MVALTRYLGYGVSPGHPRLLAAPTLMEPKRIPFPALQMAQYIATRITRRFGPMPFIKMSVHFTGTKDKLAGQGRERHPGIKQDRS